MTSDIQGGCWLIRDDTLSHTIIPVGLQLHPAELHADRALCIVGLVRNSRTERAHAGRRHGVVVNSDGRRPALVARVSLRLAGVVVLLLVGRVALRGQAEVGPQL